MKKVANRKVAPKGLVPPKRFPSMRLPDWSSRVITAGFPVGATAVSHRTAPQVSVLPDCFLFLLCGVWAPLVECFLALPRRPGRLGRAAVFLPRPTHTYVGAIRVPAVSYYRSQTLLSHPFETRP